MSSNLRFMLERYQCRTAPEYENALKEVMQELALLGLWRAKFFEHAAFYGGTALRILHGLDRFSEDLDFSLLEPHEDFQLQRYLHAIELEFNSMGCRVTVEKRHKTIESAITSEFVKAETKEFLLHVDAPQTLSQRVQPGKLIKIKIEVDTDPPGGFSTEVKTLLQPIPFSVNTFTLPDLFAGKVHAILQRNWQKRVKGRDYYDFIWFIARGVPVHLAHAEQRLRQSGGWKYTTPLQPLDLRHLLEEKFAGLDIEGMKHDVVPFLRDADAVKLWSRDFFASLLPQLKTL